MGFWDSLKAGFLGSAGVDYYSMRSSETLRQIREDRLDAPRDAGQRSSPPPQYQACLREVSAAIRELREAWLDEDSATSTSELLRTSRIDLAFIDLTEVLTALGEALTNEPTDAQTVIVHRHLRRCILAYRKAADQWLSARDEVGSMSMWLMGFAEWKAAMDEA